MRLLPTLQRWICACRFAGGVSWLCATDPRELASEPRSGWWNAWGYGDVTGRMVEALVVARRVLGIDQPLPEEQRCRSFPESLFGPRDGLSWRPQTPHRRRAAHMFDQSSVLCGLLARLVVERSRVFAADGSFLESASRARGHVHSRLATAAGVLELGLYTGQAAWVAWAGQVFDWTMMSLASRFGWIPEERAHEAIGGCETCCITDALDLVFLLAQHGRPECWDVAERMVRNHLLESQCPHSGGFSGHTMPSDFGWIHRARGWRSITSAGAVRRLACAPSARHGNTS